jgi:hypothetical protein
MLSSLMPGLFADMFDLGISLLISKFFYGLGGAKGITSF